MNRYRKGANLEREAVNRHIANGAIFAGRFAGSKCKGKLKVDVIAVYLTPQDKYTGDPFETREFGIVMFEQYKKGKGTCKKERQKFKRTKLPNYVIVKRNFIQVK